MNKLIIPIFVILIIIAGAYFGFQELTFCEPTQLQKPAQTPKTQEQINQDSPFAINDLGIPSGVATAGGITTKDEMIKQITAKISHFKDLGIKWARLHPNIFGSFGWSGVDPDHDGKNLNFTLQDAIIMIAQENDIHLIVGVSPLPLKNEWRTSETYIPENRDAYSSYIKQTVERYDGDGKDDMPGLKYSIKYWQLENEPDLHNQVRTRQGNSKFCNPQEYFQVLKLTYQALREADSEANLMINLVGIGQDVAETSISYLRELNSLGAQNYYDIFSYHVYPLRISYETWVLEGGLNEFKNLTDKPICITESGINGKLGETEKEQSAWIIKHHVFHIANGFKKITLLQFTDANPAIAEGGVAGYSGLLTFGGKERKLAYYTYKRMVEILEGSDWQNTEIIQESNGIYIYKFTKQGKPIWVVWNDNKGTKTIQITLDQDIKSVKITEAVPKYNSGKKVTDYSTAFNEIKGQILPTQIRFEIADKPVFVVLE